MSANALLRFGSWCAFTIGLVGAVLAWDFWSAIPTDGDLSAGVRSSLLEGNTDLDATVGEMVPLGSTEKNARDVLYRSAFRCDREKGYASSRDDEIPCTRVFTIQYGNFCGLQVSVFVNFANRSLFSRRTSVEPVTCK